MFIALQPSAAGALVEAPQITPSNVIYGSKRETEFMKVKKNGLNLEIRGAPVGPGKAISSQFLFPDHQPFFIPSHKEN